MYLKIKITKKCGGGGGGGGGSSGSSSSSSSSSSSNTEIQSTLSKIWSGNLPIRVCMITTDDNYPEVTCIRNVYE